jgi:hypothetical protein
LILKEGRMEIPVFGSVTVGQLLAVAAAVIGCLIVISIIKKLFKKEKASAHTQEVQCGCGWKGRVSIHAGRCPKCNTPLGSQTAKTYR